MERTDQIHERLRLATQGQWSADDPCAPGDGGETYIRPPEGRAVASAYAIGDIEFIANAPSDIRWLLDLTRDLAASLRLVGDAVVDLEWKGSESSYRYGSETMISTDSYDRLQQARDHLRDLARTNGDVFKALATSTATSGGE